jgi:membrane-associated phospholipid phosphatase
MGMINNQKINIAILLITIILPGLAYSEPNNISTFGSRLVNEFPSTFLSDANATFTNSNNIAALLLAGGASIAMYNTDADKNLNDNFHHHRAFDNTSSDFFDIAGNPFTHLGATGLWYLLSDETQVGQERAWTMLSALAITDSAAFGLKLVVNDKRPNGDNFSFPSAHTASSFCVASVLDEYYGPQVGLPAYVGAAFVSWRMMDAHDHWASDVLFGGTLGYIVGHTVAGKHKQLELAGFQIEPMVSLDTHPATGLCLVKRF